VPAPLLSNGARACGQGQLHNDERPGTDNIHDGAEPMYAVAYTPSEASICFTSGLVMHENGHTMGAVQKTAPFANRLGHCNDGPDVMC
jgi:hypothetical protein